MNGMKRFSRINEPPPEPFQGNGAKCFGVIASTIFDTSILAFATPPDTLAAPPRL
jgi:hypothetical protein